MALFLMISRKKTTLFLDVNPSTKISELKLVIQGILKVDPEEQRLYFREEEVDDDATLESILSIKDKASAHNPAHFGLTIGSEDLEITPLSSPPEYQDEIKAQDTTAETTCV